MTAAALGSRQAAVLAHLADHPDLTATELARTFALSNTLYTQLRRLEQLGLVVGVQAWSPDQGRQVTRWRPAPPGTVPPPGPPPDPVRAERRRQRDRRSQAARRARRNPPVRPAGRGVPALAGAACKGADPDPFFPPAAELVTDRERREAEAKAICARCPARPACLAWALDTGQEYGIWGGATEDERRAMLRQRRAS